MANAVTTPSTIETQLAAVKSLVAQGMLTPEQALVRMQAIHASAAGSNGGSKPAGATGAADDERKPPRVPRTPMVLSGPTQDELLQQLSTGKITVDQFKALSAGVSAKIDLAVSGNAGWLSIYLKGMQRPISMPVELAEAVFSEGGAAFVRGFIAQHSAAFDRK